MAAMAKNNNIKKILLDIAKEEKTHVGEFLTLLLGKDREQGVELEKGKEETEDLIGKYKWRGNLRGDKADEGKNYNIM
jgi:rubrerythrin